MIENNKSEKEQENIINAFENSLPTLTNSLPDKHDKNGKRPKWMSRIPKKHDKLMDGLSDFVSACSSDLIKSKEDIFLKISPKHIVWGIFGLSMSLSFFKKITLDFTESQWQSLINRSNNKIVENKKIEEKEKFALDKLLDLISKDEILSRHNISVAEIARYDKNYFCVKVYFVCGAYMLEGSIKEIVIQMREIIKEENIDIKVFCFSCSSKNLKFISHYCGCNDCGTLSDLEGEKIVKKYDVTKGNWWAEVILDVGMRWV